MTYWFCSRCEYWCTEEPFWLGEAYSEAISEADTGLAARNLLLARQLTPLLFAMYGPKASYLDYAGGWGLLVRLMRDNGFDFCWQDEYAQNLFAPGQEWRAGAGTKIAAVTAVEVFEHLVDPVESVERILSSTRARSLVFTTVLHPGLPDPRWWYLTPMLGQHISFYSVRTLTTIAERVGMHFLSQGNLHMFTFDEMPRHKYELLVRSSKWTYPLLRRRLASRAQPDHEEAVARIVAAAKPHGGR